MQGEGRPSCAHQHHALSAAGGRCLDERGEALELPVVQVAELPAVHDLRGPASASIVPRVDAAQNVPRVVSKRDICFPFRNLRNCLRSLKNLSSEKKNKSARDTTTGTERQEEGVLSAFWKNAKQAAFWRGTGTPWVRAPDERARRPRAGPARDSSSCGCRHQPIISRPLICPGTTTWPL